MKAKHKPIIIAILIPIFTIIIGNICAFFVPTPVIKYNKCYTFYDNDDEESLSYHYYGIGEYVPIDKISPYLEKCIIASEDKNFYSHHGLDYKRIVGSLLSNLKSGKIVAGASTITQQLARTLYLSNEKSIARKIKEALIAKKIEMTFSKKDIFEAYLNSIYFGHNIYGIDEASYYFFKEKPINLSLAQCALLTGIISAPSYYSPEINLEQSNRKKEQVLKTTYNLGKISLNEYQEALSEDLQYNFQKKSNTNPSDLYFYDYTREILTNENALNETNLINGVNIHTTLDKKISKKVSNIIKKENIDETKSQVAVVVMKPYSGDVLALVGGVNYNSSQFNRATQAKRQTGSTIKPLLYYLALESGLDTTTTLISKPTTFHLENIGEYSPSNATNTYANGPITMVEALALSDNIYATKTLLLLGSDKFGALLKRFGIDNVITNPTIGLGTNEMSPLQLATIFNTFASEGAYYEPRVIKESTLKNGDVIYKKNNKAKFRLNKDYVLALNYMMRAPFDAGLVSYTSPSLVNYQTKNIFAAKTGSTESNSWVVGFNKDFTIAVYVGNDNNEKLKNGALAKKLFVSIADSLTENKTNNFYKPSDSLKPFKIKNGGHESQTYYSIY